VIDQSRSVLNMTKWRNVERCERVETEGRGGVEQLLRRTKHREWQLKRVVESSSRCESVRGEERERNSRNLKRAKKGQFQHLTSRKEGYRLTLLYDDTIHRRCSSSRTVRTDPNTRQSFSPTRLNQFSNFSQPRSAFKASIPHLYVHLNVCEL